MIKINIQLFGGRGSAGGGNSRIRSLNAEVKTAYAKSKYDGAKVASANVEKMKVGDTVTVKNYRNGDIMEFRKEGNNYTISDFINIRGKNQMASTQHVQSWVQDSAIYANYMPIFK